MTEKPKTILEKLLDNSKETVVVAILFLLFSQPFLNNVLSKIPKAITETGSCSMIGLTIKAVLCALLYLAVKVFVLQE